MTTPWWQDFFDLDYFHTWGGMLSEDVTAAQVEQLWRLLNLEPKCRVLDAPCGYGRIARPLAERGAHVVGVDQSAPLLAQAEAARGALDEERLCYLRHDLRARLADGGFDCALNLFSSLGYGEEQDDVEILKTLHDALRPGGRLFVDTMHRDAFVARFAGGAKPAMRLPDGTLLVEEPRFDAIAGRVETTWYWSGPTGQGHKSASLRMYSATELVRLVERAGFRFISAHAGCSSAPFLAEGPTMGGRLGLVAERP